MALKVVVIEEGKNESEGGSQDTLYPSYIREHIQQCVALPANDTLIEVHFITYLQNKFIFSFVWPGSLCSKIEGCSALQDRPCIEIHY